MLTSSFMALFYTAPEVNFIAKINIRLSNPKQVNCSTFCIAINFIIYFCINPSVKICLQVIGLCSIGLFKDKNKIWLKSLLISVMKWVTLLTPQPGIEKEKTFHCMYPSHSPANIHQQK